MADVTLQGYSVPSQPNFGFAIWDTDQLPGQFADVPAAGDVVTEATPEQTAVVATSPAPAVYPMRLNAILSNGVDLRAIFSSPVGVAGVTPTNSSAKLAVGTPTVSNQTFQGTFIQGITRFLRRISKLNRGAN
jgi:hypothetical protein